MADENEDDLDENEDEFGDDDDDDSDDDALQPLEELDKVSTECEANYKRLEEFADSLNETFNSASTPEERVAAIEMAVRTIASELASTVMSLMTDLGSSTFDGQHYLHSYLQDEVVPALQRDDDDDEESHLSAGDAQLFGALLAHLQQSNAALSAQGESMPPEVRDAQRAFAAHVEQVMNRLAKISPSMVGSIEPPDAEPPDDAPDSESDSEPEDSSPDEAAPAEDPKPVEESATP